MCVCRSFPFRVSCAACTCVMLVYACRVGQIAPPTIVVLSENCYFFAFLSISCFQVCDSAEGKEREEEKMISFKSKALLSNDTQRYMGMGT